MNGQERLKEIAADDLLASAAQWQNHERMTAPKGPAAQAVADTVNDSEFLQANGLGWASPGQFDIAASMALSEVGALGFEIEGAEKVVRFERDDFAVGGYIGVPA